MKKGKSFKKWKNAGYTLVEVMLAVAIIIILGAVVTVAAMTMIRNTRQVSADKDAEAIYTAVSEHLQEVWAYDYPSVTTAQSAAEALDVSTATTKILYVGKTQGTTGNVSYVAGDTSGTDTSTIRDIILGENGSAISADYYDDTIIVEYNPSSMQVYSVFYSSTIAPSEFYTSSGSAEHSLDELREEDPAKRKDEFKGYLGYYHADTQNLPELSEEEYSATVGLTSSYTGDPLYHLRNLDELTAPVTIHFPETELSNINKLKIEVTVTGATSGAKAKIVYDETDNTNGKVLTYYSAKILKDSNKYSESKMFSFELVLDNLETGTFNDVFCKETLNRKTKIRFFGKNTSTEDDSVIQEKNINVQVIANDTGDYFTPGEDIVVEVTAIEADGVDKDFSDDCNSAVDNSLFAYGSKEMNDAGTYYAAYLAYARHLQNLSKTVSGVNLGKLKAYQVDDIDFTAEDKNYASEKDYLWVSLYSDASEDVPYNSIRKFVPITNSDIEGLYGDYKLEYSQASSEVYATSLRTGDYVGETEYTINGMIVKTNGDAGLFSSFSGDEIKNITLTNPRISGKGATGGFIAKATGKYDSELTLANCGVRMTNEYCDTYNENNNPYGIIEKGTTSNDVDIQDDSDVTGLWMSGKNYSGGLIGLYCYDTTDTAASGATPILNIKNSYASTVIDTTDSSGASGGLIGYVGGEGASTAISVAITSSYSDSYIYGADTGGLIGRIEAGNTVNMQNVYTASIQNGTIQAGLANGTIASVQSSYAYSRMNTDRDSTAFTTAAQITSANDVYYYPQAKANSGNAGRIINASNTNSVEDLTSADRTKTTEDLLLEEMGAGFVEDPGDSYPYNMRDGMALSTYTKPKLKNMVHYGDWEEEFMPGALVYYEKYVKAGSKVRFYGGNVNILYNNLTEGEAVLADGYGVVFKQDAGDDVLPDTVTVKYDFADGEVTETIDIATATQNATYITAEYENEAYRIYPFSTENVNHVLSANSSFYTKVTLTYSKAGSSDSVEAFYFNPYFARSVGYLSNPDADVPELKSTGVIYLRSARQLYNLSLYYKYYRASTQGRTFRQTYDISYTDYDWNGYFNSTVPADNYIVRQNPIGLSMSESFVAKYNGGCFKIHNISFVLEQGKNGGTKNYYTGLFGFNEGELSNIVIYSDYNEADASGTAITTFSDTVSNHYYAAKGATVHYYAGTDEDISKNEELYLGVLAGKNTGTITNCATAGYYMADASGTIVANSNGYVYTGGFLGDNSGIVSNCSADTPFIRLTTNYATAFIAGFVGRNTSSINNAYGHAHIEVINPRGGSIALGGFASKNSGEISNSYCATNVQSAGNSTTYAFSPKGGSVNKCNYLNKGTYSYVGHLYSYSYTNDTGAGSAKTRDDLISAAGHKVSAGNTRDYPRYDDGEDYPFAAVVTDASGNYIHYGDWQRDPSLGEFGVFYWEKEEGGDNKGYHFTYVGVDEQFDVAGTSLCNTHDDDGIIVDYGYGYYVKKGEEGTITTSATGLHIPNAWLTDVATELEKEQDEYTFYPYRTLEADATDKEMFIYLSFSGSEVRNASNTTDIRNGLWSITKTTGAGSYTKQFYVAPFFANAISLKNPSETTLTVTAQDGENTTDFAKKPGTDDNPYEIRTIEQLQFINWNAENQDVSTLITGDANIYKAFPYLAYASVTGRDKQKKTNAGHNESFEFLQTHDVSGLDTNGNSVIQNYTPIAPSFTASSYTSYTAVLYAWFGSNYDGQSYKITNVNISTKAFSVGIFGVTVSAGLENIILYSDNNSVIERNNGGDLTDGGYSIGGLVGIAYQYSDVDASTNPIKNCSVAGYTIKDESTNRLTLGESNIGGLIGATTVYVQNCSAVTNIEINCTHPNGHSRWGDYIRVGGLIGALPGTAINSYSGGSIKVGAATLAENRNRQDEWIDASDETQVCDRAKSMNVYIGGIAGSAFSMNYQNFTGTTNNDDHSPTIKNCYTYVNFPDMEGSIRSITMMCSLADRYCNDGQSGKYTVNLSNCYYFGTFTQEKVANAAKYTIYSDGSHAGTVSPWEALNATDNFVYNNGTQADETLFNNMIRGGGAYVSLITGYTSSMNQRITKTLSNGHTIDQDIRPTSLTHAELSSNGTVTVYDGTQYSNIVEALNAGENSDNAWSTVTTTQGSNNANIDGKYSFPGNNPTLDGLNYPFPTVVTQKDIVFNRTVQVHYGEWPLSGMHWAKARAEMDLFGDMQGGNAYIDINVVEVGNVDLTATDSSGKYVYFDMEEGDILRIDSVTNNGDGTYTVRLVALKTGTETVTVGGISKLILEVKANLYFSTDPSEIKVSSAAVVGVDAASKQLNLHAYAYSSADGSVVDYSDKVTWTVTIQDSDYAYIDGSESTYQKTLAGGASSCVLTGRNPGKTQAIINATCNYFGTQYNYSEYLSLQTYGAVGLSDNALSSAGATAVYWNEATRAADGVQVGANKDYSTATVKPEMHEDGRTDLYIYESYADESLASMRITGIKLNGTDMAGVVDDGTTRTYTDGAYIIDIGSVTDSISTDGNYRYRSLSLRPVDGSVGGNVSVEITLADGETNATYKLSGNVNATHTVTFDLNDAAYEDKAVLATTSMHADDTGTVDLTGIIPTLTGYKFLGWAPAADGVETYLTGAANDVSTSIAGLGNDITLYAKWQPISYTVAFNPGNGALTDGTTNHADIAATYDQDVNLYDRTDTNALYTAPSATLNFVGWNTLADGSGISYKPGATVKNLTETDGDTVTLYAQWRDKYKLSFMDYKDGTVAVTKATVDVSAGTTDYQTTADNLPDGVTFSNSNGTFGYYWTSGTGTTYRFVGWDANRKAAAAAVTYPVVFDGAGNASFPVINDIEGDFTVFAIWEEMSYSVTLIDCLTGTAETQTFTGIGGGLTGLGDIAGYAAPSHTGYTFEGWYTDRITNGGTQLADVSGLFAGGNTIADILAPTGGDNLTLYARYSEVVYTRNTSASLKNGQNYLISIIESGATVGDAASKFGYLLTDGTDASGFYSGGGAGNKDLVGIDHAFANANGKMYRLEEGGSDNSLGEVIYMDEVSMPTLINTYRDANNPINTSIPANAIWTWNDGTIKLAGHEDKTLVVSLLGKLVVQDSTETWTYFQRNSYFLLRATHTLLNYYLHTNYWNFNANLNAGTPSEKNFGVWFYEQTTVYLDEKP
ncbi:MAG: type II secretion system GspH family protein [Lachnospiraceae bacterium]|nr:type II secretion system GspH family protein [Lachnospiraceae bacterium]